MKTNHRRAFVARRDIDTRFTLNSVLANRHREKTPRFNNPQGITERQAINEGINEAIEDHPERWLEPEEDETDFLSLVIEEENFLEPKSRLFRKHTIGECLERMKNRNGDDDDYYDGGDDYED